LRNLIRREYEGTKPSLKPYAKRIQGLIDDAIRSKEVTEIIPEREISPENFLAKVKKYKSGRARTALIKDKTSQVIQENYPTNPTYYEKLRERLEELIEEEKKRRKDNAKWFDPEFEEKLRQLYEKSIGAQKEREKLGFDYPVEFSIYEELQSLEDNSEKSKNITKTISEKIIPQQLGQ